MKKSAPLKNCRADKNDSQTYLINSAAQRQRLLEQLGKGPLSTLSARLELDILHPAARVQELRESGYNIVTHWQYEETIEGQKHRVAKYVLFSGKWKGSAHGR